MRRRRLFRLRAGLILWASIVLPLGGCGSPSEPAPEPASESRSESPSEPSPESPSASPPGSVAEADAGSPIDPGTARAEDFVDAEAKAPAESLREPRFAAADFERGELLSYACRACHALEAGQKSPLGPHLAGVIGRRAGTLEGFEYSQALRDSGIVWTPEAIEAWLAQPEDFIPGNNMAFTGYRSARDRRDLVAYLLRRFSAEEGSSSDAAL